MSYLTESKSVPSEKKKKFKSWSKEETINGVTKCIRVEEVMNGYIISYSKYGRPDGEENAEYIDESYKKSSATNPFEKKEESDESETMGGLMSSANNSLF